VSLAPTHVSWLVGKLVGPLVTLSDFQSLVSNGRSNKKSSKNKVYLFSNFASGRTLPTHKNVYEGLNARKCKGRSNQKIQKTKCIYFLSQFFQSVFFQRVFIQSVLVRSVPDLRVF